MIEDLPQETFDFYERHCASGGVVIAFCYDADGEAMETGVFSSLEKASEWVSFQANTGSVIFSVIFSPYVIDQPDFGSISSKELLN